MARIPLEVAQRRLDPAGPLHYPSGSPVGSALQNLGSSLQGVAERIRQRDDQRDNFTADIKEREFQARVAGLEDQAVQNAAIDGRGIRDSVYGAGDQQGLFDTLFDEYAGQIPEGKRQEFIAKRQLYKDQGSVRLATQQYGKEQAYYKVEIAKVQNDLVNQIATGDPASFEQFRQQGIDLIDKSGIPALEKEVAKQNWRANAGEALFASKLARDPSFAANARAALGLAPKVENATVLEAMQHVESGGDPNAVSPKGASGLMQVMPATGAEIAQELGDTAYPKTEAAQEAYLKRPDVSRRYGEHYFNKMMARYGGDQEAALIAYNGGPVRADAWLAAGRDDSVIPKESANYYKKVAARMGEAPTVQKRSGGEDVPIITRHQQGRISAPDIKGVSPAAMARFRQLQNAWGGSIPIVSGYRDKQRNKNAGGAKSSQHIHGSALDLDVSDMTVTQRKEFIRAASAAGFTGIGVYKNSIHVDIGPRRSWGPSHGSESVPDWARSVIADHLTGKAAPSASIKDGLYQTDDAYAGIPFERRLALANQADVQVNQAARAASAQASVAYTAHKDAIDLALAQGSIRDEDVIAADRQLNDGDKAVFIRRIREQNKDGIQVQADLAALGSGNLVLDAYEAKDKTRIDKAFAAASQSVHADQRQTLAEDIIRQTGIVPDSVVNDLRRNLSSTDAVSVADAMQSARRIQSIDSAALARRDGGGEVKNAADDFSYYVNTLNMEPRAAAQKIIDARDPEKQRARKALEPAAKEFLETAQDVDIGSMFDGWFSLTPSVGITPDQEAGIKAEYLAIAEEQFFQANGDPELAKVRTDREFKNLYGVSALSGASTVMKHPPEKYWPSSPYATDKSEATGFLWQDRRAVPTLDYAKKQLRADVIASDPDANVDTVRLWSIPETDADVKAGRLPGYSVMWQDQNGAWQTLPGKVWRPDTEKALEWRRRADARQRADTLDAARAGQSVEQSALPYRPAPTLQQVLSGQDNFGGARDAAPVKIGDPTLQDQLKTRQRQLFENAPEPTAGNAM